MTFGEAAVAVKSTTGALTAAGVWTGVIIASLALLGYIVKVAPSWRKIGVEERQDDLDRLTGRIDKLETAVKEAETHAARANEQAHNAEMSMVTLVAALQLVMGEVEKLDPGNKVLIQAREMVAAARTGDFGMNQAINRLSMLNGVGER